MGAVAGEGDRIAVLLLPEVDQHLQKRRDELLQRLRQEVLDDDWQQQELHAEDKLPLQLGGESAWRSTVLHQTLQQRVILSIAGPDFPRLHQQLVELNGACQAGGGR
jgi:hypothetical protein